MSNDNNNSNIGSSGSNQKQKSNNNNQKMPLSRSLTQPQGTIEYVVAANDTITSVAARFHTTPSELARINRKSGHFIFPGQVLYVPKSNHLSSLSADNVDKFRQKNPDTNVPPNTPNDPSISYSPSRVITTTFNNNDSPSDNNSPVPGYAERVVGSGSDVFIGPSEKQHHPLIHTASEPVVMAVPTIPVGTFKNINLMSTPQSKQQQQGTTTIDPADRECLERFLKISVRYITDGQGVVSGVLLVTPNALMFDSNVLDPLVMEHGSEMYNVTVPIELVLKTALYSDIAHMRVKHAPEAVPSVPKPSVYYASDEDTSGIVEENLKNVYAKKKMAFDTIGKVSEEKSDAEESSLKQSTTPTSIKQPEESKQDKQTPPLVEDSEFKNVVEQQLTPTEDKTNINPKSCDDVHKNNNNPINAVSDVNTKEQQKPKSSKESSKPVRQQALSEQSSLSLTNNQNHQEVTQDQMREDEEIEESSKIYDDDKNSQKKSDFKIVESMEDDLATSMDQSLDLMTSIDDPDLNSFSTPPSSATDYHNQQQKKPIPYLTKISLAERHSAPLQVDHSQHNRSVDEHKPLQSAVSAEETCSDPVTMRQSRLSAAGENRRGQMLKRFSNPVDTIGNLTKSGFNATKTSISKGLNATQSGISTGYYATKSGLTTGISVTKTGFNKVLATPKNLMDFSSVLVRDAKGALAPTGSKSDMNLQEHLENFDENNHNRQKTKSSTLGYYNMVDTKIDALENFDKLLPRPARVNKDAPLYLCIRMGKYKKDDGKRNQRFSPTYSFGKNKYEREYWFSVPKDKAKNLYHFFKKWAPEVYGDVDDISGCEQRGLEPLNTDDEFDLDDDGAELFEDRAGSSGNICSSRRSYLRISSQDKESLSHNDDANNNANTSNDPNNKMNANTNRQRFWRRSPLHFLKLVEDHFSTDGLSTDWNVSNSSEEHSFAERYNLELNTEPILPELIGQSELLNVDIIKNLSKHLPARADGYAWTLIYSTSQHGFSLNTLYRDMRHFDSPILLMIEDTNGAKFGALLSHSLRISDHFYGTGETFLFSFYPTFECFPWTGENIFFIKGNLDSISIGAGEGNFGLWLDGDLYHGSSHPCKTFGNRTLSSEEDFVVKSIECWGFV